MRYIVRAIVLVLLAASITPLYSQSTLAVQPRLKKGMFPLERLGVLPLKVGTKVWMNLLELECVRPNKPPSMADHCFKTDYEYVRATIVEVFDTREPGKGVEGEDVIFHEKWYLLEWQSNVLKRIRAFQFDAFQMYNLPARWSEWSDIFIRTSLNR